jgi:hypothetical protein
MTLLYDARRASAVFSAHILKALRVFAVRSIDPSQHHFLFLHSQQNPEIVRGRLKHYDIQFPFRLDLVAETGVLLLLDKGFLNQENIGITTPFLCAPITGRVSYNGKAW